MRTGRKRSTSSRRSTCLFPAPQLSNFFSFPCFQLFQSLFHAGDVIFPTFSTVFPTLFHFSTFFHCSFLYAGDGTFPPFLRHFSASSVFQFSSTFNPLFQAGDVTQCGVLLVSPHRPHVLPLFIFSTTLPFFHFFNSLPFSSTPVTLLLHLVPLPFHFLPRFPFFTLLFQVYDVTFPFLRHFFSLLVHFSPLSTTFPGLSSRSVTSSRRSTRPRCSAMTSAPTATGDVSIEACLQSPTLR